MSKNNKTTEPTAPQALTAQFSEQIIDERLTPNPLSQFSMDKDCTEIGTGHRPICSTSNAATDAANPQ